MNKRYKEKDYTSKKCQMEFPIKADSKIEPHKTKNFDYIDITSNDTPKQEFLSIQLVRNKTPD